MATWKQIENILDQVLELEEPERTRYIEEHIDDEDLKAEIRNLLQAELHAPAWIDTGVDRLLGTGGQIHDIANSLTDQQIEIDRYRIVKEIGRGGMSVVYLAERTDGEFDQQVAVKIIQPFGLDREDRFRRLRAERQILASLKHPNIARVFDGGITPEGWPYMVMELVEGMPIITYCHEKDVDLHSRLDLFQKICDAVIYAHRNLVVHRDLKPGNILVTDSGEVKLLDFGIAKMLEDDPEAPPLTQTGRPLMTPEYAAPEQFRGETVTTSVDVYSLGVILYELLAGERPYALSGKSITEMERLVCEEEPPKPSENIKRPDRFSSEKIKILHTTKKPAKDKPGRSPSPDQLQGDLDVICLKALRKEPEERYKSVQDLREDLIRYQLGLPIQALPASMGYRMQKFIKRNKASLATVALCLIAITGFAIYHIYQVTEQRNIAQAEAEKARQVASFVTDLFHSSNPENEQGAALTASEMLDRGVSQLEDGLVEHQEVRAVLLQTMGDAYRSLGYREQARPLLEEALNLQRMHAPGSVELADALVEMATLESAEGNAEKALSMFEEALQLQTFHRGMAHDQVARIHNDLGIEMDRLGRRDDAIQHYKEAIEIRRNLLNNQPDADLAANLFNLANLLHNESRMEEAEDLFRESLNMVETVLGPDHIFVAYAMGGVADILKDQKKYEEAFTYLEGSLTILQNQLGNDHPEIAATKYNIASLLRTMDRLDEAERYYREVLELRRRILPEGHRDLAISLSGLGMIYLERNETDTAWVYVREAVDIWEESLPEKHWHTAVGYGYLGQILLRQNKFQESESYLKLSYEILNEHLGRQSGYTQDAVQDLIDLYENWNKPEKAAEYRNLLASEQ